MGFSEYLALRSSGGVSDKRKLMAAFDDYSKERFADFVRNFAEVQHRSLSHLDMIRIRQKIQSEMRSEFEWQFRLMLA